MTTLITAAKETRPLAAREEIGTVVIFFSDIF